MAVDAPSKPESAAPLVVAGLAALVGLTLAAVGISRLRRRGAEVVPGVAPPVSGTFPAPTRAPVPQTMVTPPTLVDGDARPAAPPWLGTQPAVGDVAYARTVEASPQAARSAVWCGLCGAQCPDEARFCPIDGTDLRVGGVTVDPRASMPAARAPEMKAFAVGAWRCDAHLGEGGMGVVYRARHVASGAPAAVKVLHLGGRNDAALVTRFRREARLAASVRHPNSVEIYEFGEVAGRLFYLAMELVDGRSLDALLDGRPMPVARVAAIVAQVCSCLEAAHAVGVVHRDLKPQNVMVRSTPEGDAVKLVDFGIARDLQSAERTLVGAVVGTPGYMAPEQARGDSGVDARADVFALGVMTYEMLTGTLPYQADGNALQQVVARATLRGAPTPASARAPWLHPAIDGALTRALDADVEARTATVRGFYEDFAAGAVVAVAEPVARSVSAR